VLLFAVFAADGYFSVTTLDAAVAYNTIYLGNCGRVGWVTRFEQFCYTWQTTGDVAGSAGRPWNFGNDVTGADRLTIAHIDVCTNR
jgi:hypothetical protein